MRGRVLVGIPQYSGIIRATFPAICSCLLYAQKTYPELYIEIKTTDRVVLPYAHKRIAYYFLRRKFDWLFLLEEDIIPPEDALVKLLQAESLVVSGVYYLRSFPHKPVNFKEYTGLGCILLKKEVFEHVSPEDFKWSDLYADDYYFCQAMLDKGLTIVVDKKVQCKHVQEVYRYIDKSYFEKAKERLRRSSIWVAERAEKKDT